MGFESGKRQRESRWLKELYDGGVYDSENRNLRYGFSVHRSYPIIRSNTGKPTYLELKWAIGVIRLWANGVATRRVPMYPSEAAATKQKGGFSGERKDTNETGKPKTRETGAKVDHLPQVQARHRHAPVRRKKRKRAPRVRA
jgi:hypothetical protein